MVGQSPEIPSLFSPTSLTEARPDWSEGLNGAFGARPPLTLASFENVGTPIRSSGTFAGDANAVPPTIRIQPQNAGDAPPQTPATATVQKDGSVLDSTGQVAIDANGVVKNQAFLTNPPLQSDLTIAVQRDAGQAAPNDAQQNVLNRLTDIWAKNIQTAFADKLQTVQTTDGQTIKQVNIDDPSQLASQAVEQKYGNGIPQDKIAQTTPAAFDSGTEANPTPDISRGTSGQAGQVNRDFPQGGTGTVDAGDANRRYFPPRAAQDFEKGDDGSYLNMLHSMAQMPFDRTRHVVGGQRFGGYDMGPHTFNNWMLGFLPPDVLKKLGNPPKWELLAELLNDPATLKEIQAAMKEKGAPKELQDQFATKEGAQKFAEFAGKVTTGHGDITAEDMKKFMPEALQSRMALDTVHKYKEAGAKPNDIALGWVLDKTPDKLTAEDRSSDHGKAIQAAGNRLFQLSYAGRDARPGDKINWTGDNIDPNSVAYRLVRNAAATMDGTAYGCVRSHQANMRATFGFTPHGNAFDCFKDTWRHLEGTGKFELKKVTSAKDLLPGDIFGVPWTGATTRAMGWGVNAGHLGTIGTNGREYSQHAFSTGMIFSGRYDINNLYVIRAKTSNT